MNRGAENHYWTELTSQCLCINNTTLLLLSMPVHVYLYNNLKLFKLMHMNKIKCSLNPD